MKRKQTRTTDQAGQPAVMQFEPDLVIIHTGHNEFFGAYGVASINRAGSSVAMLQLTPAVRSLALVQAVSQ